MCSPQYHISCNRLMVAVEIDMKTRLALISWLVGQIHKRDNYVLCHKDDLLFLPNQKMVSEMAECSLLTLNIQSVRFSQFFHITQKVT